VECIRKSILARSKLTRIAESMQIINEARRGRGGGIPCGASHISPAKTCRIGQGQTLASMGFVKKDLFPKGVPKSAEGKERALAAAQSERRALEGKLSTTPITKQGALRYDMAKVTARIELLQKASKKAEPKKKPTKKKPAKKKEAAKERTKKKAEAARKKEEAKKKTEAKKKEAAEKKKRAADEKKKKAEADKKKKEEAKKKAEAEKRKADEAKKKEEAKKKADEKKKAEAKKRAEEAKKKREAEEKRKAEEEAKKKREVEEEKKKAEAKKKEGEGAKKEEADRSERVAPREPYAGISDPKNFQIGGSRRGTEAERQMQVELQDLKPGDVKYMGRAGINRAFTNEKHDEIMRQEEVASKEAAKVRKWGREATPEEREFNNAAEVMKAKQRMARQIDTPESLKYQLQEKEYKDTHQRMSQDLQRRLGKNPTEADFARLREEITKEKNQLPIPVAVTGKRDTVMDGVDQFQRLVHRDCMPGGKQPYGNDEGPLIISGGTSEYGGGAFAYTANHITVSNRRNVVIHEMGHWLEHSNGRVSDAATHFVLGRAQQGKIYDPETKQYETFKYGQKIARVALKAGWDIEELNSWQLREATTHKNRDRGMPDGFARPYVGRFYEGNRSSEVISVGMQFFDTPQGMKSLYDFDPEHFVLIYGVTTGEWGYRP